jgi:hypothetical protein
MMGKVVRVLLLTGSLAGGTLSGHQTKCQAWRLASASPKETEELKLQ